MEGIKSVLCSVVACVFLAACSGSEEFEGNGEKRAVSFRVANYQQYSLDEVTRAESSVEALAHLAFGVYSVETKKLVATAQIQDRGAADYGVFTAELSHGKYRVAFLGYNGDKTPDLENMERISFPESYVPHTFLYSTELTVDDETPALSSVVLKRAVAAFRITLDDAIPAGLSQFRFTAAEGGTVLNALTGYATENRGRVASLDLAPAYEGRTGISLTVYLFLPEKEISTSFTVDALDSEGNVMHSRTFDNVQMKVNAMTCYQGTFFTTKTPSSSFATSLSVDYEWEDGPNVKF